MAFALASYTIVSLLLFYIALSVNFDGPPPRNFRFNVRWLLMATTVAAILFGLAATFSRG